MIRISILCGMLACMLIPSYGFAQNTLSGQVKDQDNHGVADASVYLIELRRVEKADQDGNFSFANVPAGNYTLQASSSIYGNKLEKVEVTDGDTNVVITFDISIHENLTITATPKRKSISDVSVAVGVLNKEDLIEKMEPTLGETLANEPGVSSTYFGPGASRPVIRGLGGDRIRVLEGGLASGDASSVSQDHATSVDTMTVQRIEILRGPASLRYGSTAVGGAVNVIDNRIPEFLPSAGVSGAVELRGNTVSDEFTAGIDLNGGKGNIAWHLDFTETDTDDYDTPPYEVEEEEDEHHDDEEHEEGEEHEEDEHEDEHEILEILENSALDKMKATAGISYITDRGFIGFSVTQFETKYGVPGHAHGHHEEEGEHHEEEEGEHHEDEEDEHGEEEEEFVSIDLERTRYDMRGELRLHGDWAEALNFRIATADYEHVELEGDEIGTTFANEYIEGRAELTHNSAGIFDSGSIGVQYSDRDFEAVGAEAFVPPNQTENLAFYVYEEIQRGKLNITLGGRFERQESSAFVTEHHHEEEEGEHHDEEEEEHEEEEGEFVSPDFSGFSSAIGFVYGKDDTYSYALNLTRTERAPTPEELFSNGPHLATQAFEVGNPDLDKETSLGIDVMFRKRKGKVTGELSFFRNDFSDFIYERFTGEEEDGLDEYEFVQGDAVYTGAELHLDIDLIHTEPHHLHMELTYDTVKAELDSGGYLPRITPDRLIVSIDYAAHNFHAEVSSRRIFDQSDVAQLETETDGYTFIDASLGYHFLVGPTMHKVLLRGTNLSDELARNHVSFLKDRTPLPGRNLSLSYRMNF